MMQFQHRNMGYGERHVCDSYRVGDWIVYICPRCDYEMRENWRTGEISVRNPKMNIKHSGSYFPREYKSIFENLN